MTPEAFKDMVATPWNLDRLEVTTVEHDQAWSTSAMLSLVDQRDPDHRMQVTFDGVSVLRLAQNTSNMGLVLEVVEIADRGWENIRYAITDQGNGTVSFYCQEITITRT